MDRGAWWAAVHSVTQTRTRLSDLAAAAKVRNTVTLAQLFKLKLKTTLNNKFITKKIKMWMYIMDI